MIPKVIHYCWFGRNPLPKSALKCIASWKKFFPDYEIKDWNEDNFDVNMIPYTKEAYEAKKYAFVSDYARFWILYHYGGIYFDTDVEVIKPMDDIIERGAFMGREAGTNGKVAPGLGLAVEKENPVYRALLDIYDSVSFLNMDGSLNLKTIVNYTTDLLIHEGLKMEDVFQIVSGINIYPSPVFCPMDSTTGIIRITDQTVSIHHYDCTWMNHNSLRFQLHRLKNFVFNLLGIRLAKIIIHISSLINRS